jgi:hypothetical protein
MFAANTLAYFMLASLKVLNIGPPGRGVGVGFVEVNKE